MGIIVGTAGHIDHGKSTLMLAITGKDPDRLKEEKERGITIELGYVFLETADGDSVSFIDVPGHEKFIKTMVAGVATVDCFLLVVSADEGVMPQTTEHLDILRLLEVDHGIVALTKTDLVDDDLIELAEEEVREALLGTPAESAPIMRVSAKTMAGIEELKKALIAMAKETEGKSSNGRFRMPIDRIFTLKGFGTIVCGTGLSGSVKVGDTIELQPSGQKHRVRELGVNEERKSSKGFAGDRIAINLTGLKKEEVYKGSVAGEPGFMKSLSSLDTTCTILNGNIDLQFRQRVRFHVGTAEVMARAIPVSGEPLLRGQSGFVHFQLEHPVVAMPGDRFVIRRYSPVVTIGGGVILDTGTRKVRSRLRESRLEHLDLLSHGDVEDLLFESMEDASGNFIEVTEFIKVKGIEPIDFNKAVDSLIEQERAILVGEGKSAKLILFAAVNDLKRKILGSINTVHRNVPLSPGLPAAKLARKLPVGTATWVTRFCVSDLERAGELCRRGDFLASTSFSEEFDPESSKLAGQIMSDVEKAGLKGIQTPVKGRREDDIEALIDRGLLVEISDGILSSESVLNNLKNQIFNSFGPNQFRLGELRELLGVSRKFTLMWAELLDKRGITVREDETRRLL